ncbi:MAG: hypothetical protein ACRDK3_12625 [Actinomycetota bacterium]
MGQHDAPSRLVYYSIALPETAPRPDLLWQLEASLRSLRTYNTTTPVALFVHGEMPSAVGAIASRYNAVVHIQEPYEARLARLCPHGWRVLSRYPLLHKFLNFGELRTLPRPPRQVLFLDCDTLFFGDVDRLFARYENHDCVAREEASCRRSHLGYDPEYLDEGALDALARAEGIRSVPPFNLGVVLFNGECWWHLADLEEALVSYAWRFAVWMACNPAAGLSASYGEGSGIELLRNGLVALTSEDVAQALPYPSANRWILDEFALWLTLGNLPGLRTGDFWIGDVLQNGEFSARDRQAPDAILCHYFTQNMARIDAWMQQQFVGSAHLA